MKREYRIQNAGRGDAAAVRDLPVTERGVVPRGVRRVGAGAGGGGGAAVGAVGRRVGLPRRQVRLLRQAWSPAGLRCEGLPCPRPPALRPARCLGAPGRRVPRPLPPARLASVFCDL